MSQGTSPLPRDKGPTTEPGKAVGIKRLQTDTSSSSGYHNVYVRRKVESEHSKVELKGNGRDKAKEHEAQQDVQHEELKDNGRDKAKEHDARQQDVQLEELKGNGRDKAKEHNAQQDVQHEELKDNGRDKAKEQEAHQDVQHEVANRPQVTSGAESVEIVPSKCPEKPNAEIVPEKTEPPFASGTGIQEDVKQLSIQYWNERFNRLQTYLESCDHSTHEGYLRKLRSLSAAGRSIHAIELEKRAIHLLVEEGKELQRMKALNVLGKVSPNASSKPTPLQRQSQK